MNALDTTGKRKKKLDTSELGGLAVAAGVRRHAFVGGKLQLWRT